MKQTSGWSPLQRLSLSHLLGRKSNSLEVHVEMHKGWSSHLCPSSNRSIAAKHTPSCSSESSCALGARQLHHVCRPRWGSCKNYPADCLTQSQKQYLSATKFVGPSLVSRGLRALQVKSPWNPMECLSDMEMLQEEFSKGNWNSMILLATARGNLDAQEWSKKAHLHKRLVCMPSTATSSQVRWVFIKINLQHAQFTLQDPGIEAPRPTLGSMSSSSILLTNTIEVPNLCVCKVFVSTVLFKDVPFADWWGSKFRFRIHWRPNVKKKVVLGV